MPKNVALHEETYEALKGYKIGGMTFDEVIRRFMAKQDPEEFHREYREWQKRVVANMMASGEVKPL